MINEKDISVEEEGKRAAPAVPAGFVWVEGGSFQMGSGGGEDRENPVHGVKVKSFYMGRTEVTQKEWAEVMGGNRSRFKGANLPVDSVSWFDVIEYCDRRSEQEGLTPAYRVRVKLRGNTVTWNRKANGYRLPTEAEWEYAAKGGIKGGAEYIYSGSDTVYSVAWYRDNSGGKTHPVGTKAPNSLGLYDMSGNLCEWCWDRYRPYGSIARTDPAGASSGPFRVLRGGCWSFSAEQARSAYRGIDFPAKRADRSGFRLVLPAP